jgi:hypothetical protein
MVTALETPELMRNHIFGAIEQYHQDNSQKLEIATESYTLQYRYTKEP